MAKQPRQSKQSKQPKQTERKRASYPVTLSIKFPERELNRLTSFFRPLVALPILIILLLISGMQGGNGENAGCASIAVGGILFIPTVLMLLFRWKYPRWWFDWNVGLTRFFLRVASYLLLLTDLYPSTDEEQDVRVKIPYPDPAKDLKTGLPLVKWLLAVPHYVVLAFLAVAVVFVAIIAWFAILFTGSYPRGLFDFVTGVLRWGTRVSAYAFLLVTDEYPPFSLE
jgi:hypothetical protein